MSYDEPSASTSAPQKPVYAGKPLELRVHGVSGTPPESLLDRPLVSQVGGDKIAGFYRPRLPAERFDDRPRPFLPARTDAPELEGYNWGGLTSGSPGRALWLFLLPFTLINLAPRARPLPENDSKALRYLTWLFSRWLALALTLMLVLTSAGIGVNLAGWQCSFSNACKGASDTGLLDKVFGTWNAATMHRDGGWDPEVMLFLGSLIPLIVLLGLWLVSKRTIDRYESVEIKIPQADADGDEHEVEANLGSPSMWRNQCQVRRIRATHMQAGVAAAIWVASEVASPVSLFHLMWPWNWGESDLWSVAVALLTGSALAYSFVVLSIRSYVGHQPSQPWQLASLAVWASLIAAGILSTIDLLTGDVTRRHRLDVKGHQSALPGFDNNLWALVIVMFVLLFALIVVVVIQSLMGAKQAPAGSDHATLRPGLLGCAGAALAAAAVLSGAVFSASTYTIAASWLNTGSLKPSLKQVSHALNEFAVPDTFRMATFVFVLSIGLAIAVVAIAIALFVWAYGVLGLRTRLVPDGAVVRDYGDGQAQDANDPGRRRAIERAMFFGALLDKGLIVVGMLVSAGVVMTFVGAIELKWGAFGFLDDVKGDGAKWVPKAEAWGAYGAVLLYLGLIALTSLAFRVPATRKGVGIIWDVASFWPRGCHPLAAPCYAERTVPDLVTRLHHLRMVENRPVVLAAHSQGTVLSAAALFNLKGHGGTDEVVNGIGLLTFGCVLRRLYGRFFPVYFGSHRMHELQGLLTRESKKEPRWLNLWRYTDYLGGQVTAGPPQVVPTGTHSPPPNGLPTKPPATGPAAWEWHAPDPPRFKRRAGETTYSAPGRHSNFWMDDSGVFQLAVQRLVNET